MTREYRARHAMPCNATRKPYVIVRDRARHAVTTTGKVGA